jgi:hypothetical protein
LPRLPAPGALPGLSRETRQLLGKYAKLTAFLDGQIAKVTQLQVQVTAAEDVYSAALAQEAVTGVVADDPRPRLHQELVAATGKVEKVRAEAVKVLTREVVLALTTDKARIRAAINREKAKVAADVIGHVQAAIVAAEPLRQIEATEKWLAPTVIPVTPPRVDDVSGVEEALLGLLSTLERGS